MTTRFDAFALCIAGFYFPRVGASSETCLDGPSSFLFEHRFCILMTMRRMSLVDTFVHEILLFKE